jgi:hypothetical protein
MPTSLVDYSTLKSNIFVAIYYPPRWRTLAIITGDANAYAKSSATLQGIVRSSDEALLGIRCSDTAFKMQNVTDLVPTLHEFREMSWIIGD